MAWHGGGGQEVSRCRGGGQGVLSWRYGDLEVRTVESDRPKSFKTKGNTVKTTPKSQKFPLRRAIIMVVITVSKTVFTFE